MHRVFFSGFSAAFVLVARLASPALATPVSATAGETSALAALGTKIPEARLLWQRDGKILHSKIKSFNPQPAVSGSRPRWSPNGQQILFERSDGVWLMKQDFSGEARIIDGAHTASWTRDGKAVTAVASDNVSVVKYVLSTKAKSTIFNSNDGNGQEIAQAAELRAGGRYLLTFRRTPTHVTEIIDIKDPKNPKYISNAQMERGDCSPAWAPDGSYILNTARTTSRPVLKAVFDATAGTIADSKHFVGLDTSEKFYIHGQRVSNDGKYVAFGGKIFSGSKANGAREIYIWRIGEPEANAVRMTFDSAEDEAPSLFIPATAPPPECVSDGDCDDSDPCTMDECAGDACQHSAISGCCKTDSECGDGDPCTADACASSNSCGHAPVTGCCTKDNDCDDGNPCTSNNCQDNVCTSTPVSACCGGDADCDDGNPCTVDACDAETGACSNVPSAGCCSVDTDCDDDQICTADRCDTTSSSCEHAPISGCCTKDSQCDDGAVCTADTCDTTANSCVAKPISGCCTTDSECDDANACSADSCVANVCASEPLASCCSADADCVDNNPCTTDSCDTATGVCDNSARAGCCSVDVDCGDADDCTIDSCDLASNSCVHEISDGCDSKQPESAAKTLPVVSNDAGNLVGGCVVGSTQDSGLLWFFVLLLGLARRPRASAND